MNFQIKIKKNIINHILEEKLKFYLKNGFENVKTIENYYTDIEPKAAYYLRLKLH